MNDSTLPHTPEFPLDVTYRMKRGDFWMWTGALAGFGALGYYFAFAGGYDQVFMLLLGIVLLGVAALFIPVLVYESYFAKDYLLITETDISIPKGLIRKGHTVNFTEITGLTFEQEEESDEDRYLVLHRGQQEPLKLDREYFKHDHAYQLVVQVLHTQLGIDLLVRDKPME